MIVPYRYTLRQAASSSSTQAFLLIGTLFLLPIIPMYTAWSCRALNSSEDGVAAAAQQRGMAMAKTYRDVAIDQMIATVEEAMSHAIDWWGGLPKPMNEAVGAFRVQLAAAIDSVEFVKKALDRPVSDTSQKPTEQR